MKLTALLLSALLLARTTFAATLAVLPDTAIQAKVDLAQPGDIVAIFGGTYPGDITINKAIRLVEVDGQDVTITGNVTFTGITNAPPFEGFTVGSPGKGITVSNVTGLVVKDVDARAGFGVVVNGTSSAGIIGGQYSDITQDGGTLTVSGSNVANNFTSTVNCQKTIALRTTVVGRVSWSSARSWFGYSKASHFNVDSVNGRIVVVGSEIDGRNFSVGGPGAVYLLGIDVGGSGNKIVISNCTIKGYSYGFANDGPYVYINMNAWGIRILNSQQADIFNNYIQLYSNPGWRQGYGWQNNVSDPGIEVQGSNCRIYNNIIDGAWYGISAPFGADVRNNFYYGLLSSTELGGFVSSGSIVGDPLFVSGDAPRLQAASPCLNAGVNDPIFNDLDGSRNNIGPTGGCLYDPDGWTSMNPVVIAFDLAPQQLLKGVDTQVNLTKGQAVAQP